MTTGCSHRRVACWATVLASAASVAAGGCSADGGGGVVGAQPVVEPEVYVLPPPTADTVVEEVVTLAQFGEHDDGVALPDPDVTTGTVFADVTAVDICEVHYTQGVRQPRFNDKVEAFANYGISIRERDVYAVDHLVPVSLGGNNTIENLWPQPYDGRAGAAQKDLLERQLRGLVCSDLLDLAVAQRVIATDWWDAYHTYMGLPIEPGSDGPAPPAPPSTAVGQVVNGGPCEVAGDVGYTEPKRVPLVCTETKADELIWQKRY